MIFLEKEELKLNCWENTEDQQSMQERNTLAYDDHCIFISLLIF